jgi:hypothetical protein
MIAGAKPSVSEDVIMYQARTKLAELSNDIAALRKLNSPEAKPKIKKAKMIFLWLQALDYRAYLSREQREKIWYALIHIAGLNDFPIAPLLELRETPNVLLGIGGTTTINNTYDAGTAFLNSDVDSPSEVIDSFATTLSNGCRWEYTIQNAAGTILRKGSISAGWTSGGVIDWGAETVAAEIGDASGIVLSAAISGGNVQLIATVGSNDWRISGKRYLD